MVNYFLIIIFESPVNYGCVSPLAKVSKKTRNRLSLPPSHKEGFLTINGSQIVTNKFQNVATHESCLFNKANRRLYT